MIEKNIHQVWVGDLPAPTKWLNTWPKMNPGWNYTLWDNEKVFGREWVNQEMMDCYARGKRWEGVADIVRYEILYNHGGFMPGADSECLRSVDKLFEGGGVICCKYQRR